MSIIQAHAESIILNKGTASQGPINGEFFTTFVNRNYRYDGTVPGFIYCPGLSAGAASAPGMAVCRILARRGYPGIAGDFGDTPSVFGGTGLPSGGGTGGSGVWGNDSSISKLDTYKTYLQGTLGAKSGKIILIYGSHGCALAYNWARANPSLVYCIAGAIGACDLEFMRSTGASRDVNYQTSIEAAYTNNATWQSARSTHNPIEYVSTLSAIPQLDYYGETDNIVDDGSHTKHVAFGAAAGSAMTQVMMSGTGHSIFGIDVAAFCDWVEAHLS